MLVRNALLAGELATPIAANISFTNEPGFDGETRFVKTSTEQSLWRYSENASEWQLLSRQRVLTSSPVDNESALIAGEIAIFGTNVYISTEAFSSSGWIKLN